ncbi:SIS domain-containing protein [Lactobacillus xylocopicola]|uniref:Fructosamine deglycase n=1 Tax=Lactobacillus xylocopicola TaxID=2976676 RepID=A0ABM8BG41_9LACO|nr:SIS domain-containing protein [Lactobacillus xylocopicola]BDR60068.1 sugar isomerase [Lactobacillus xylocopicola]
MDFEKVKTIVSDIKQKQPKIDRVMFVGCGASMADLYPGYYFISHESTKLLSSIQTANEFNYNTPKGVGDRTIVITASLGGSTPESVEATKKAKKLGAHVITLSMTAASPIIKATEYKLVHGFQENYAAKTEKMSYCLALAMQIMADFEGYKFYDEAMTAFAGMPALIEKAVKAVGPSAQEFGEKYKDEQKIFVLSSGASLGVAYSTASFLLMEMQWVTAPTVHSGEYFHGPFELTVEDAPYLLFMNDGSTRQLDARALTFMQRFDAKITNIDAKDYGLGEVASANVIDYFNPMIHTGVMRVYAEELAKARKHPLTKRRYMWKLSY